MQTKTDAVARAATSRKTLSAKTKEFPAAPTVGEPGKAGAEVAAAPLPAKPDKAGLTAALTEAPDMVASPLPIAPVAEPVWSNEDEATFQAMFERRKAARFFRRGRDTGGQLLRQGAVAPNPGTVNAIIVGLIAERDSISRGDLVAAMASAKFPQTKARPTDRAWCQGYVAGALRDGFLALVGEGLPAVKSVESAG